MFPFLFSFLMCLSVLSFILSFVFCSTFCEGSCCYCIQLPGNCSCSICLFISGQPVYLHRDNSSKCTQHSHQSLHSEISRCFGTKRIFLMFMCVFLSESNSCSDCSVCCWPRWALCSRPDYGGRPWRALIPTNVIQYFHMFLSSQTSFTVQLNFLLSPPSPSKIQTVRCLTVLDLTYSKRFCKGIL